MSGTATRPCSSPGGLGGRVAAGRRAHLAPAPTEARRGRLAAEQMRGTGGYRRPSGPHLTGGVSPMADSSERQLGR
jgi:hypothetical protein